jgi:hypothetical protein
MGNEERGGCGRVVMGAGKGRVKSSLFIFIRCEGYIPRPLGAEPRVCTLSQIPYENNIPRPLAVGLLIAGLFISCNSNIKIIPFELPEFGRIVVKAEVNGTKGKFLWDTGMDISQVNCRFDNLEFISTGFSEILRSVEELDYYTLPEITIGGVRLKTATEITKVQKRVQELVEPEGLDGILGINVFHGYWCAA